MTTLEAFGIMIPIVAILAVFTFASISAWAGERTRERMAFYRYELYRKLADSPAAQTERVIELEREESQRVEEQRQEGQRIGGLVTAMVGIGVCAMFAVLTPGGLWGIGLVPLAVGAALLVNACVLAPRRRAAGAELAPGRMPPVSR